MSGLSRSRREEALRNGEIPPLIPRRAILRVVLRPQVQEPDTLRSALCRRGADGVLGLHAAVAQLQTTKFRLRSCEKKVLDHLDLSAATSGVLR